MSIHPNVQGYTRDHFPMYHDNECRILWIWLSQGPWSGISQILRGAPPPYSGGESYYEYCDTLEVTSGYPDGRVPRGGAPSGDL